jgi:cytosine/adenosine deaminase-related metal-dependent hydrolase
MARRLLLKNVFAITNDGAIGELEGASILIEDGKISAVARDIDVPGECEVIDGEGMIAIPGFCDTHKHQWQAALRGVCGDMTLLNYMQVIRQRYIAAYRPEDVKIGTYTCAIESLNGGVTSVFDHAHCVITPDHADAALEGMRDAGMGGIWGYGYCPVYESTAFASHGERVADAKRMLQTHFSNNRGALRMGISITEQSLLPFELTEMEVRSALDMDVKWTGHVHCGSGPFPISRGVHKLYAAGLINHLAVMSHCNEFSYAEFQALNDAGAWFVSTPDSELYLGLTKPTNLIDAIAAKTEISLGTDTVACMSADMFSNMRLALIWARHQVNDPKAAGYKAITDQEVSVRDVFRWATINGAKAMGIDHLVGSLSPGKLANIALIRTDDLNMAPIHDPVSTLVLAGHASNVDSVLVAGEFKKRAGKLVDIDVPARRRELEASLRHLSAAARKTPGEDDVAHAADQWSDRLVEVV